MATYGFRELCVSDKHTHTLLDFLTLSFEHMHIKAPWQNLVILGHCRVSECVFGFCNTTALILFVYVHVFWYKLTLHVSVSLSSAAVVDLNGRYFGGRIVKACFYNLDKFRVLDLGEQFWCLHGKLHTHQQTLWTHLLFLALYITFFFLYFLIGSEVSECSNTNLWSFTFLFSCHER